jgi:acetyltransferase
MDTGFTNFHFSLRDGRRVHVRAMRPTDEDAFLEAFGRLSPDARYMRFMRVVGAPNVERLRQALAAFPASGLGIVAIDGDANIVGSATFLIADDPTRCEFATTVADTHGGQGLGRALMTALITAAKQRGLREMDGFVLARNRPMLRLAARLGFSIAPDPEDPAISICRLPLADG